MKDVFAGSWGAWWGARKASQGSCSFLNEYKVARGSGKKRVNRRSGRWGGAGQGVPPMGSCPDSRSQGPKRKVDQTPVLGIFPLWASHPTSSSSTEGNAGLGDLGDGVMEGREPQHLK